MLWPDTLGVSGHSISFGQNILDFCDYREAQRRAEQLHFFCDFHEAALALPLSAALFRRWHFYLRIEPEH